MNLYAHQKKIVDEDPHKVGLWLGTGSGKTRIALLLAKGDILVIAPKTQVEDRNWEREYRFIIEDKIKDYKEHQPVKIFRPRLTVMSKEEFRRDAMHLPRFHTVIVDEAHTCLGVTPNIRWRNRNPVPKSSQLFEALEAYIARTKPDRLYLCTATIIQSPMTVWAAGKLLGQTWDWYKWRESFYIRLPMPGREVYQAKRDSATKDRLAKAAQKIGYTGQLSEYFDVPTQTYKVDYVDLSTKQKQRIKELPLEYPDPLVLVGKKHQVENGILSGDEFNAPELFHNEKIEKILEYSIQFPKMIIFAKYRTQIEQIASAMIENDKKVFILTGDTKKRGDVIKEANKSDEYIFIIQSSIAEGYELPSCPVMIFASLSWSIVSYVQAQGRILRANKLKKNLFIHLVVKEGIDEYVYKAIMAKEDFHAHLFLKNEKKKAF